MKGSVKIFCISSVRLDRIFDGNENQNWNEKITSAKLSQPFNKILHVREMLHAATTFPLLKTTINVLRTHRQVFRGEEKRGKGHSQRVLPPCLPGYGVDNLKRSLCSNTWKVWLTNCRITHRRNDWDCDWWNYISNFW